MISERVVPLCEIFEIRVYAAVAKRCRGCALIGLLKQTIFFGVAEGAIRNLVFSFLVGDRVMHLQRSENAVAKEFSVRFS